MILEIVLDLSEKKFHSFHDALVRTISLSLVKLSWHWHCPGCLPSSLCLLYYRGEKILAYFILLPEQSDTFLSLF